MAITRGPIPTDGFTIISNAWLRDPRTSAKAKGLLAYIASHAVGFRLTADRILADMTDGETAIRSGLAELEAAGYLTRTRRRAADGRLGEYDYRLGDPVEETASGDDQGEDDVSAAQNQTRKPSLDNHATKKTTPKKTREDQPSGGSDEPTAQTIIKGFIDWLRTRPQPLELPGQVIGRLGRDVKQLLTEGFPEKTIKLALASLVEKDLIHRPSLLQTEVVAVQQAKPTSGAPAGAATRKTFAEMREDHAAAKKTEAQLVDAIMERAPEATVEQAVQLAREIIERQTVAPSTMAGYIDGVVTDVTSPREVTS